ncbi:hypothetical protein [Streptomonospora wellingtoniae]|uniref:WXG100 family type VII secretion target n=1 Tax=Streptomonospora wellingtoniae TaxID=3075544 RepID=A0ABU2KTY0_9ACTN|nr:hypothetical protein [Streptomonospora sp. DSM 45055]MDT0302749.1 hypothetical protein [Streptomonospora sp. DSM 45055]
MNTEIPPGLTDGIDPSAITIPPVKVEDLEEAARAIKGDGEDVRDLGNDITSAWGGLQGVYSAPEDEALFSAIDPVAAKGDEVGDAARTAGDALLDFAADARPILERWRALKQDAQDMQDHIEADDDWRSDEDKVEEFNQLNNDLIKVQNDFMAAERECANKITALFGGTTFVAADPGAQPDPGKGEQSYGYTEAPEDVATPWAVPQEHDAPWYADVGAAVVDLTWGSVKDTLGLVGLHDGQGDWTLDPAAMWDNATQTWSDTIAGVGMLAGYGPGGFSWSTADTAWKAVAHSMVPWNEWGDRPGYVITQSVVNIGSIVAGVALTASGVGAVAGVPLLAWRGTRVMRTLGKLGDLGPGSGHGGDSGGSGSASGSPASGNRTDVDLGIDGAGPRSGIPTTREIQNQLADWEDMAAELGWEDTMRRAGDLAETVEQREPALVGAPNDTPGIQANAEGPSDPPSTSPRPAQSPTESPSPSLTPSPSGEGGPPPGEPPNGGGGGGRPPGSGGPPDSPSQTPAPSDPRSNPPSTHPDDETPGPHDRPDHDDPGTGSDRPEGSNADDPDRQEPSTPETEKGSGDEHEGRPPAGGNDPTQSSRSGKDDEASGASNEFNDAEREQRLRNADNVEQALRNGGLTDEQITRLFGDHPRDGDQWNRVHGALNQQFPGKIRTTIQPKAIEFAFDGASDPREFAYRYEYYHAIFREQVHELKVSGPSAHEGMSRNSAALERMPDMAEMTQKLESDHEDVLSSWGDSPLEIDASDIPQRLDQAVDEGADRITMGHPTSASYHSHKHFNELPAAEQGSNKVDSYHQSAVTTIRDGDLAESTTNTDGSIDLKYRREYVDEETGETKTLQALLVIRPDGLVIMKTYGAAMG